MNQSSEPSSEQTKKKPDVQKNKPPQPPQDCHTLDELKNWLNVEGNVLPHLPLNEMATVEGARKIGEMLWPIFQILKENHIEFALQGSGGAVLQTENLDLRKLVIPGDIDILIQTADIKRVNELLKNFLTHPVMEETNDEKSKSVFAQFNKSDAIGDLAIRVQDQDGKFTWYDVGEIFSNHRLIIESQEVLVNELLPGHRVRTDLNGPGLPREEDLVEVSFGRALDGTEMKVYAVPAHIVWVKHQLDYGRRFPDGRWKTKIDAFLEIARERGFLRFKKPPKS